MKGTLILVLSGPFHYRDGDLWCDDVPLNKIVKAVGTPVYVYSNRRMLQNAKRLQTAFPHAEIHYSLKANANLSIIKTLYQAGMGMDAVSGGEIFRALIAGVDATDIVFAGVGKTRDEIAYALQTGIGWFNAESESELSLLNELAGVSGHKPTVALRLNPNVQAKTHPDIATGHGSAKFGMDSDTISRILTNRSDFPHLIMHGIHMHVGSQLGDVYATIEAVKRAQMLARPHASIRTLNIGGGFPVNYGNVDEVPSPEDFAAALRLFVEGWQLKLEPGRFIVADAGALVMTILHTKVQAGKPYFITDGSMTELIRPALYGAKHPVVPLRQVDAAARETVVAGPVCESTDVLGDGLLPSLATGDHLALLLAGAYGFVMASNYNQRPRPPEVLVEETEWRVIRRRETWDDLVRFEQ